MKFHDASRCPSNTDVSQLDCVSSEGISMYSFFTTFNLIVYILFTVALFFVLSIFTQIFISYFSKKIPSWLGKVSKLFSGQNETDLKTVEFNKSLGAMRGIISINKVVIVSLFVILLILSMFLYKNYTIPIYFSSHFCEILKAKYNTSIEVPIGITILTLPVHYFQKAAQLVLGIAFGFYRTYLLVRTLEWSNFKKHLLGITIIYYFHEISDYILKVVLVDNDTTNDIPFIKMCEACNASTKLLFYSLLAVLISVTLQKTIYFFKKSVISPREALLQPNLKEEKQDYNNQYLFYNILVIFLQINTSIALIGAFHGILYLFTHYIPIS